MDPIPVSVGELVAFLRLNSAGFDGKIASAQSEMRAAAGSADAMAGAVDGSSAALAGAGRTAGVASSGTAKFRAAQLSAVAATERYNAVLAQGDASLGRLASAEAAVIRANQRVIASNPAAVIRETSVAAAESSSRLGGVASGLARSGKQVLGLGAAFGVFELVKKAIDVTKEANEYQRAMVQVQTNTDTTAAEVSKASGALLRLSGDVATAPKDLAVAFYHAKSVGLDYAQSLDTVKIAAEGAKVGHADVEETMNALTSTVASGIPGVKDMSSAMGQLIATVGAGDMKLSDLNEALGTGILTKAQTYGLSLKDVGAALATFGDLNMRGAEAATQLRMGIEAMAKPAKGGAAALRSIGLEADTLRNDMQAGGLNKAVLDLNAHLKAAGITGTAVGGFLLDAFSKKGASGVTLLVTNLDRLESKFAILRDSGASFGDKWKATTQTAAYAVQHLEAKLQAAAITLTSKLGPSIATAANWLGTTLPHAVSTAEDIMGPFAHTVGVVLVDGFKAAAVVLKITVSALAEVGDIAKSMNGTLGQLATEALAVYAAFKVVGLSVFIFKSVQTAIILTRVRLLELASTYKTLAAAEAVFGVGSLAAVRSAAGLASATSAAAVAARRAAMAFAVFRFAALASVSANADQISAIKELVAQYKGATNSTDLSARAIIRWASTSENAILPVKAVTKDLKITADQLAIGVSGTDAQFKKFVATLRAHGKVSEDDTGVLNKLHDAFEGTAAGATKHAAATVKATAAEKAQATALGSTVNSYLAAEQAAKTNADQTAQQTLQFQFENNAIGLVNQALDKLAGKNLSNAEAQTALGQATVALTESFKTNGSSVSDNTAKGLANRQAIEGTVNALRTKMQAEADATGSTVKATTQYHANAAALLAQIGRLEGTNSAAYRYAQRLLKIPPVVKTKFDVDAAAAISHVNSVHDAINNIPRWIMLNVGVNNDVGKAVHDAVNSIPGHAMGGTVSGSGNGDTELRRLTPGEEVTPKRQAIKYRPLLKAIAADNVSNFATGGTVGAAQSGHRSGPLRVAGGRLEISADSQGNLQAWVKDLVLDERDHRATVGRMYA